MVTLNSPQWVKSNWASRPGRMHLGEVHLLIRTMQRRLLSLSKGL